MNNLYNFKINITGKLKHERDPIDVLNAYISVMNNWESACSASDRDSDYQAFCELRNISLAKIYSEYCTAKNQKKVIYRSFQIPPEYDPKLESIVEIKNKTSRRTEIFTKSNDDLDSQYMYVLLKEHGAWLLDNKKRLIDNKYEAWEL